MRLKREQRIVILLVVLFTAPVIVAFLFASKVVDPRTFGLLNKGTLIEPPVAVGDAAWPARLVPQGMAAGDWLVVTLFPGGSCDSQCRRFVEDLNSLPLILGQDGTRVRVGGITVVGGCGRRGFRHCAELAPAAFDALFARVTAAEDLAGTTAVTALMDWRGNLMIGYGHPADRNDVKTDLKRLLKASRV